jgi:hypothetical protein
MTKKRKPEPTKPADILRYYVQRPRIREGEILCHNRVKHLAGTSAGWNGFRYFVCKGGRGHGWKRCPCGWRPDFGPHYAAPAHVEYQRKRIAKGKPLTMWWPHDVAVSPCFKRVGREGVAQRTGHVLPSKEYLRRSYESGMPRA